MKKDELLGMEVFYEDNPQQCEPRGHEGHKGPEGVRGTPAPKPVGVWAYGDSDEDEDEEGDFDDIYGESSNYEVFDDVPAIPVRGRIYHVKALNTTAKLDSVRPLTKTTGILEMSHHGQKFYINPSDLRKASIGHSNSINLVFGPN